MAYLLWIPPYRTMVNKAESIEAMQNAPRFIDDVVLRERLKEAKGIVTPATRAEIIGGLKKQAFLIAQGKNIVPTATGLMLFGVLKRAESRARATAFALERDDGPVRHVRSR